MKKEIDVRTLTDDFLDELMTNVINEREGTRDGTKKAERLDNLYWLVDNEMKRRKNNPIGNLYDELSRLLTDYEHHDFNDGSILEWTDAMYEMLCKIQNAWELINVEG